jgi:hypothetical protein
MGQLNMSLGQRSLLLINLKNKLYPFVVIFFSILQLLDLLNTIIYLFIDVNHDFFIYVNLNLNFLYLLFFLMK